MSTRIRPSVSNSACNEDELVLRATRDDALHRRPDPALTHLYDTADVIIRIEAEDNPYALRTYPPSDQEARQDARFSLIGQQLQRLAAGTLRRCTTHYPTSGYAAAAGLTLDEYTDLMHAAMLTDTDDPVQAWLDVAREQQRLADQLAGVHDVRIGELTFSLAGRPVDNSCGKQNLPDGELCFAPLEHSVNGWVVASGPAYLHDTEVRDLRLEFTDGRVSKWDCSTGTEQVAAAMAVDDAAVRIGEIGLGMNSRVTRLTGYGLIDTKMAGTMSISLGQGHSPAGSANHSPVHWTFPVDLQEVSAGGVRLPLPSRSG